jgi:hypothetical protein
MQLSTKQKEVIKLMREGKQLWYETFNLQFKLDSKVIDDPQLTQLKIVQSNRQLSGIIN